jgi:hypothetical protein
MSYYYTSTGVHLVAFYEDDILLFFLCSLYIVWLLILALISLARGQCCGYGMALFDRTL